MGVLGQEPLRLRTAERPRAADPEPAAVNACFGSGQTRVEVNCSDFPTHAAAQKWFDAHGGSPAHDVAGLDGNGNGVACQSLP